MGLISFPVCYVLFILHILRNTSSFALHIPSKDIMLMTLATINSVAKHCVLFICTLASGNGFISERLRLSLKEKGGSADLNSGDTNKVIE